MSKRPIPGKRVFGKQLLALMCAPGLAGKAFASGNWPERPVRVLVPFPAGGLADSMIRAVSAQASKTLGTPFVVDNRPGAAGQLMYQLLKQSAPDGYTLGYFSTSAAVLSVTNRSLPFDVSKDFEPVTLIGEFNGYLTASAQAPGSTLRELVEHAKKHPDALAYGSFGNGSQTHLQLEKMLSTVGARMTHVPYKGEAPILQALASNEVQFGLLATYPQGFVESGKVKVLATTGATRSRRYPQVPTVSESGVGVLQTPSAWAGLCAPAGLPPAVRAKLTDALVAAAREPEVVQRLESLGYVIAAKGPAEVREALARDIQYYGEAVKAAKLKLD
ncbi:MAG: Bug family tripartite tricarboxylate transporter substrate binding protein [Burkholderiaceae bacterium]